MKIDEFGMDTVSLVGPLESRLAAMRTAGFTQVMLDASDLAAHPGGLDAAAAAVRASGLRVTGLQQLRDYEGLAGKLHDWKLEHAKQLLTLCRGLGCKLLLVSSSTSEHASTDQEAIVRDLRKLSMLALPHGIKVAYQALSWGRAVKDVVTASEVVSLADMSNLGLALDAFHLFAAGTSLDELDLIETWKIFMVQLSDFLWRESADGATPALRVFPGEGMHSAELAQLVKRLDRLGYRGDYSFEVFNEDDRQLPPTVVTERARQSALWLAEDVLQRSAAPLRSLARQLR